MPPVPQRNQKPQERMCPACGGPADRAKPKGSVACRVCGGAMEASPLGKQALTAAAQQGAQKIKAAMAQRQQAGAQRPGMARPGMGQPGMPPQMGARPGMGAPQGQGQAVDPRAMQLLAALAQRRGR